MPWYSLSTVEIIQQLRLHSPNIVQAWLADDSSGAGKVRDLFEWYKFLEIEGKKYDYFVNGPKSWLIVKNEQIKQEAERVFGKTVNITADGKRHLGAVIGSDVHRDEYCKELVEGWLKGI